MKWTAQEQDALATRAEDISKMNLFDVHIKQGNPVMIVIRIPFSDSIVLQHRS
jgi:hypothetical protein